MRALRSLILLLALLTPLAVTGCFADADDGGEPGARDPDEGEPGSCSEPAPLLGELDPNAPGYIVVFEDGIDPTEEAARLAAKYSFEVINVYQYALSGFYALMSEETVERVRCQATVAHVSYNSSGTLGALASPVATEAE